VNPLKGKYIGMVGVGNLTVDPHELRREENRELRAENKQLKKMFYEQPEDPMQIKAIKRDLARFYGIEEKKE
jgi:ribosomal protein L29